MGEQQAKDLSMLLRTGALPASISYLQESTIGPSLGADSIRQGVLASVIGMVVVMIFMLVYYRGAGINADLALLLNLIILLGFMGFSGSTLTLPGIAGVILTIGMGVDSNVLIFERIREELHSGKSPGAAVDQGFAHAWTTIIDTHVTTIVSAAILFISWDRAGTRFRRHADHRLVGKPLHRGLCIACDLRLEFEPQAARRGAFDMSNPLQRAGSDSESSSGSLVRGGLGLLGGIALCMAALLAQAGTAACADKFEEIELARAVCGESRSVDRLRKQKLETFGPQAWVSAICEAHYE